MMMRTRLLLCSVLVLALTGFSAASGQNLTRKDLVDGLTKETSPAELFMRAYEVFSHPRCSNCHPADNRPRWGSQFHGMNVQRGVDKDPLAQDDHEGGYGRPGLNCRTCHQKQNGEAPGSPPGAPGWRLAPIKMGWSGLNAGQLCQKLKQLGEQDPEGRGINGVIAHIVAGPQQAVDKSVTESGTLDKLVAWAWDPGPGRESPPGTSDQFVLILQWWRDAGAGCPQ